MTQQVMSYTPHQKAIALAAFERYGLRPTIRLLEQHWGFSPAMETFYKWRNAGVEVTDDHRDFWVDYDRSVQAEVKQRIPAMFDRVAGTVEWLTEDTGTDGAPLHESYRLERLAKLQGATISLGILYDKVFPQARTGVNVNANDGATVNLMVVAAPGQAQARAYDED